jgi:hypothetical protein
MNDPSRLPAYNRRWSIGLAATSTLVYLLEGLSISTEHPAWYRVLTSLVLLDLALLISAWLCLRNGLSQRISNRQSWFLLGCGLLCFLCGNIFFNLWEIVWGLNPAGSLGDPFFVLFYVSLTLVILATISQKKIVLKAHHWSFLVTIASSSCLLAVTTMILAPTIADPVSQIATSVKSAPAWVLAIDTLLKPHATNLNYFYVWSDVVLFCLAAAIVMGFWLK